MLLTFLGAGEYIWSGFRHFDCHQDYHEIQECCLSVILKEIISGLELKFQFSIPTAAGALRLFQIFATPSKSLQASQNFYLCFSKVHKHCGGGRNSGSGLW